MATGKDVKAGGAFVELFTKSTAFDRGLRTASAKLKSFADGAMKYGTIALGAGLGLLTSVGLGVKAFVGRGDDLKKASDRLGIGVESLSALDYAAQQSGSNLEGLEKGIRKLQQTVYEAATGNTEAAETFETLGLSVENLIGMKPDEMWLAVADALSQVENVTARNALAMKAFGKTGTELIPLLLGGSKGVRELMAEAKAVGSVISAKDAAAAERIGDSFERVWASIKNTFFSIGALLSPFVDEIEQASHKVVAFIGELRQWLVANKELVMLVFALGTGLVALGSILLATGFAATALATAFSGLAIIGTVLATPIGATIAIIAALAVALGMALGAWMIFSKAGRQASGELLSNLSLLARGFAAFVGAMLKGDWEKAGKIAFYGFIIALKTALITMTKLFTAFTAWVVDEMLRLGQTMTLALMRSMAAAWSGGIEALKAKIVVEMAMAVVDAEDRLRKLLEKEIGPNPFKEGAGDLAAKLRKDQIGSDAVKGSFLGGNLSQQLSASGQWQRELVAGQKEGNGLLKGILDGVGKIGGGPKL